MEDIGREIVYPTIEQVCDVNRRMVKEFGGLFVPPDNLLNPHALGYILDTIRVSFLGSYPTLKEKAAAITYRIISGHVFHDGNKRTGTHIAWEFLHANGISLLLDQSIVDLVTAIAKGQSTQDQLLEWLHEHQ